MESGETAITIDKKLDSGFSEKKLDQDTELQAGQWLDLSGHKSKSIPVKIDKPVVVRKGIMQKLSLYADDLLSELKNLVADYKSNIEDESHANAVAKDIEKVQSKLHTILRAMRFEQKGSLDITKLPKEAQDLLK